MSKVVVIVFVVVVLVAVLGIGAFFIVTTKNTASPAVTTQVLTIPQTPTPQPLAQTPVNQIKLVVLTPVDKAVVTLPTLKVTGQTVPNADVAINEIDTKSDASGNFSANVSLNEGDNPIIVDAFDENGNTSEQELTVTYSVPGQ